MLLVQPRRVLLLELLARLRELRLHARLGARRVVALLLELHATLLLADEPLAQELLLLLRLGLRVVEALLERAELRAQPRRLVRRRRHGDRRHRRAGRAAVVAARLGVSAAPSPVAGGRSAARLSPAAGVRPSGRWPRDAGAAAAEKGVFGRPSMRARACVVAARESKCKLCEREVCVFSWRAAAPSCVGGWSCAV